VFSHRKIKEAKNIIEKKTLVIFMPAKKNILLYPINKSHVHHKRHSKKINRKIEG